MSDWNPHKKEGPGQASLNAIYAACVHKYGDNGGMTINMDDIRALPDGGAITISCDGDGNITLSVSSETDDPHAIFMKPGD